MTQAQKEQIARAYRRIKATMQDLATQGVPEAAAREALRQIRDDAS